ncbi:MAG: ABC transporter substrate-binding protein [Burkholderiaceae bacterium]
MISRSRRHLLIAAAAAGPLAPLVAIAKPTKLINLSYVRSPFNLQSMVMVENSLLEKEFAADGIAVKWHTIDSGAVQSQAIAAGSIDIAGVMNTTSLLLANAGGNPLRIATGVSRPARTFALVGAQGGPKTFAELRGKKVAGPRGTVLHQLLVAGLARAGLSIKDVEFHSMDPGKSAAALAAGQVDAALIVAGLTIKALAQGAHLIASADGLVNPLLAMVVRQDFAARQPELLARVVRVHRATSAWIAANPDAAIAIGARVQGVSLADARQLAQWSGYTDSFNAADVASIKADQAFLIANGMMKAPIKVDELFLAGSCI